MKSLLLMHKHIIVRQLLYSHKTFALFTCGLFKLWLAKQKLPKLAKYSIAKVRQICVKHPDEFLATPAGDLHCNLCDVLVKCDEKFLWKAIEKVSNTKKNWRRSANPKVSKPFYYSIK